jgi:hypothetical protein
MNCSSLLSDHGFIQVIFTEKSSAHTRHKAHYFAGKYKQRWEVGEL